MEALLVLLGLYLFAVLIVLPIWTVLKIGALRDDFAAAQRRADALQEELNELRAKTRSASTSPLTATARTFPSLPTPEIDVTAAPFAFGRPFSVAGSPTTPAQPVSESAPPVPPLTHPDNPATGALPISTEPAPTFAEPPLLPPLMPGIATPPAPPPLPPLPAFTSAAAAIPPVSVPSRAPAKPKINWEHFMGAKLFAWLGGFALFLGVAFFVKYSFDHDLIPPAVRAAAGFILAIGLVIAGLKIPREKYAVTAQTLIATGIVSLYAVTFACNSIYKFEFFGALPTFLLMVLITATAFLLAVRLNAQVVALLGMLGGFLTPVLLSTGVDNPPGLFGYLALLDIGLVAVALHRRWFYLVALAATGTSLMMIGWAGKFYIPEKTSIAMLVCLGFCALFLAATEVARRCQRESHWLVKSALALPAVAFLFAALFLNDAGVADRTEIFFGFVTLVSVAVFILALRQQQGAFVAAVAGVTTLLLMRWTEKSFAVEQAAIVVGVCLFFCALYLAVYLVARHFNRASAAILWSAIALPSVAFGFSLFLMSESAIGARPGLLFSFILLADIVLLTLAWLDDRVPRLHLFAGLAVFALLSTWTGQHLTDALLPWALGVYLLFAALHTVFPLLLQRRRPAAAPTWWSQLFPPLTLLLMLFPLFKLESVSFLLWPAILLVDLLAIGLAVLSASLAAVAAVLVLTLLATALSIFNVPVSLGFPASLLLVLGGFAVFFFAASLWLVRKLGPRLPLGLSGEKTSLFGDVRSQIPAFSSLLPYILLIMVCLRLSVPDPSAVFGLALLLAILTLGLARIMVLEWLPACALLGVVGLEYAWSSRHFDPAAATLPLFWYLGFHALFTVYPFVFRTAFARRTGPWAVAALSGVGHFPLVYRLIQQSSPNTFMGVLPALFALPPLLSLVVVLKKHGAENPQRLNQLAWFGGVALLFITLIFPIQFERQWLTVAWALEGAALIWLFQRVPHPGLRATGVVLLIVAFARLALNPSVLGYHARADTAIFNWYLYAYGLAALALFAGARLLAPSPTAAPQRVFGLNVAPALNALGVILAFFLLNLEIADYFTPPGARSLAFQFSGNFARDMSYTIGWALFALALLGVGLWRRTRAARFAAIGLLSVALLKLFFHDLTQLEALYRIGAFFAVAVIAILASFAYQRFLPSNEKTPPPLP